MAVAMCVMGNAAANTASAQDLEGCRGEGAKIRLVAASLSRDEGAFGRDVSVHLRAALRARGIGVCAAPDAFAAAVEIFDDREGRFTIVVKDALLSTRVERTIDLSSIPPDGRSLALALATDELLRASWAELLRVDARPRAAIPPEVHRDVAPDAPPRRVELGTGFAMEHHTRGLTQFGGDVSGTFWILPRWGLQARAGFRAAPTVEAPGGEIRATAMVGSLGALVGIASHGPRLGLDMGARLAIAHVRFAADANGSARAHDATKTAVYLNGGPRGWFAIHRAIRIVAELGLGAPLHALEGLDGDQRVTGLGGLQLSSALGVAGVF